MCATDTPAAVTQRSLDAVAVGYNRELGAAYRGEELESGVALDAVRARQRLVHRGVHCPELD